MAALFHNAPPGKVYWDRSTYATFQDHIDALESSSTLYVGNLSFSTKEAQIAKLFQTVGPVKRVIMGLDRIKHEPCGFCFVEYWSSADAMDAINYLSGACLDERIIRAELDPGFREGRQFGRGASGGQVRDEKRKTFDPDRGGLGAQDAMHAAFRKSRGLAPDSNKRGRDEEMIPEEQRQEMQVEDEDKGRGDGDGDGGDEVDGSSTKRQRVSRESDEPKEEMVAAGSPKEDAVEEER